MTTITIVVGNLFTPLDTVSVSRPDTLHVEFYNDPLPIQQAVQVTQYPLRQSVGSFLDLQQSVHNSELHLFVADFLALQQQANRVKILSLTNYLNFSQLARPVLYEALQSNLAFAQQVLVTRGLSNQFVISQALTLKFGARNLSASNNLALSSHVTAFKQNNPYFIISAPLPSAPPKPQAVVLSGSGQTVTLRAPDFGDKDKIEHTRINRKSRGGDTLIFRDEMWPKTENFSMKFSNLSQNQIRSLLDFIQLNLGLLITLTDSNGDDWSVMIVNPDTAAEQVMRADKESCGGFTIELNFETYPTTTGRNT